MRPLAITVLGGLAVAGSVGCGGPADTGDFRDEAENFIESDDYSGQSQVGGLTFSDVECEEPASTDVGTVYSCTGTGADGQAYGFTVNITDDDTLAVSPPNPQSTPTAESTPPATTAAG